MLLTEGNSRLASYQKLFLDLKKDNYFGRLGKTFKTSNFFYFLDTGTGKVARVNENVYCVLKCLLENDTFESLLDLSMEESDLISALKEIQLAVEKEYILSAPLLENMYLEESLDNQMRGVTLEITEECNLRCKYCIYNETHPSYREFGKRHMSLETAKKSIDLLKKYICNDEEVVYIGFYGGEPLLNFNVIKDTIEYANETIKNKKIQYNITTNATLLTESISDYLVKQDVTFTLSLDGPEEIHDESRIYANGKGSFNATIKGIDVLMHSYEKHNTKPSIMINIVITGTDYEKKYEMINNFLKECSWYSTDIPVRCNMVDEGPREAEYIVPQSTSEKDFFKDMHESLGEWSDHKTKYYTDEDEEDIFSNATLNQDLLRIHKRQLLMMPIEQYSMNGCCVPGQRKSYVSVDGDIFPCERIGNHIPTLGNVDEGFNNLKIKKYYVNDFIQRSRKNCRNCWAVNLCGICYAHCYDENGINLKYKNNLCLYERFSLEGALVRYYSILENNPKRLEIFNEMSVL